MQAPFGLYYVELFKRYWHVRTAIRRCIKLCDSDPEHQQILVELDALLSSVVADKAIKGLVKKMEYYNHFFMRLCLIFRDVNGHGKAVREQVEKRTKRYLTEMKNRSKNDPELKKITSRLEKYWNGLFMNLSIFRQPIMIWSHLLRILKKFGNALLDFIMLIDG